MIIDPSGLRVYYQPIVRIDLQQYVGAEALIRFNHNGSIVTAGQFLNEINDPINSRAITDFVLRTVFADMRVMISKGINFQHIGINVTHHDIAAGDLVKRMKIAGGEPCLYRKLVIEITEFVDIANVATIRIQLQNLKELGTLIAFDDFGTGFASLKNIQDIDVDLIKIDMGIVSNLSTNEKSAIIIHSLLTMAKSMGIKVVAEGIENTSIRDILVDMGCILGQGFLYSPAVCSERLHSLLTAFGQNK